MGPYTIMVCFIIALKDHPGAEKQKSDACILRVGAT